MFYPGDPIDRRKRELVRRLGRSRGGGRDGFAGDRIGRVPGFLGKGFGFGSGMNRMIPQPGRGFEDFAPQAFGLGDSGAHAMAPGPGGGDPVEMPVFSPGLGGGGSPLPINMPTPGIHPALTALLSNYNAARSQPYNRGFF